MINYHGRLELELFPMSIKVSVNCFLSRETLLHLFVFVLFSVPGCDVVGMETPPKALEIEGAAVSSRVLVVFEGPMA